MQNREAGKFYGHKKKVTYADNNVPVYKLRIAKLPKQLKSVRIEQHFSKFGQLINVEILYGKTRSFPTQCIIHYQNAKDAGAALKQKYHTINHQRVKVQSCPGWEQPYLIESLFAKSSNNVNLLTLNDYCLERIFQHLDLRQQLRLSLCHSRLDKIFTYMICSRLQRTFYLEELLQFSTREQRQFLKTADIYMERFVIAKEYQGFKSIRNICAFLKEFRLRIKSLHIIKWMPVQYRTFLTSLQLSYIGELEMYRCNLKDIHLKCFLKLPNLKVLGLARNHLLKGTYLKCFRKLERLSLYECWNISNDEFSQCCRHLHLSYLDIRKCIRPTETIVYLCKNLDTIKLSGFIEYIVKLPKLRSLEVHHSNSPITIRFYNALVEHHADNLRELKLTGETYLMLPTVARIVRLHKLRTLWLGDYAYNGSEQVVQLVTKLSDLEEISLHYSLRIRDQHLLPLIIKCTKLKRINLRMCRYITSNFIWSTLEILSQRIAAAQPLVILVYGTRIKADILRSSVYRKNRRLLKLLFHDDKQLTGLVNEGSSFDINDFELNRTTIDTMDVEFMNDLPEENNDASD
uniref:RRM domain-containing protein n=2 Tax=Bactrocera latifrons TaxID=174628 RepID=A0A0K8UK75_BACLA